jgi:hypothetical protein
VTQGCPRAGGTATGCIASVASLVCGCVPHFVLLCKRWFEALPPSYCYLVEHMAVGAQRQHEPQHTRLLPVQDVSPR